MQCSSSNPQQYAFDIADNNTDDGYDIEDELLPEYGSPSTNRNLPKVPKIKRLKVMFS
jgi:hypothetical protein